jgi:hypothetical protein
VIDPFLKGKIVLLLQANCDQSLRYQKLAGAFAGVVFSCNFVADSTDFGVKAIVRTQMTVVIFKMHFADVLRLLLT